MKKRMRKVRYLLSAIAILTVFCGINAFAADRDVDLAENTWAVKTDESFDTIDYKITIPSTGYIKTNTYGLVYGKKTWMDIQFLDKNKQAINENWPDLSSETHYYAVKKGVYYIRVPVSGQTPYQYQLRYDFVKVSEKSGTKKSKAVTIKKNKTITGLIQSGEALKKYDWYKIKLTKAQKVTLSFTGYGTDYICYEVIPANKKAEISLISLNSAAKEYSLNQTNKYKTFKKLAKGTYYIRVYKNTGGTAAKVDCGMYKIKWK
ncbi:MAG: hypothetical protein Q4B70_00550 [Lachnospiraceae bacterium]|nr:hypothetical protein [Lachnospiraceae bacterium]